MRGSQDPPRKGSSLSKASSAGAWSFWNLLDPKASASHPNRLFTSLERLQQAFVCLCIPRWLDLLPPPPPPSFHPKNHSQLVTFFHIVPVVSPLSLAPSPPLSLPRLPPAAANPLLLAGSSSPSLGREAPLLLSARSSSPSLRQLGSGRICRTDTTGGEMVGHLLAGIHVAINSIYP